MPNEKRPPSPRESSTLESKLSSIPGYVTSTPTEDGLIASQDLPSAIGSEVATLRWKELVNKLSWAIGSTYGLQYSKKGTTRSVAIRIASVIQIHCEKERAGR